MALVHHAALDRPRRPRVSVCIANYNGEHLLADCLSSLLDQQDAPSFEILVHDDASTDRSIQLLRQDFPQVTVLASSANVGFCKSNNRLVDEARGEFVLLLNNDAALYPDALATLLRAASIQQPGGILTLPQYDWDTGQIVDRGCLLDYLYNPVPNLDSRRREVAYVIGACLWMPRQLWHDLGGLPDWMGSIAEDLYIGCLARLHGLPVDVTASSGYRHRQGASFGGNRPDSGRLRTTFRRRFLSERNKTFAMIVCTPTPAAWILLAVHLMLLTAEGLALSLLRLDSKYWLRIYGPAILDTLKSLPMLMAIRRVQQAQRTVGIRDYFRPFAVIPRKLSLLTRHGLPSAQ